MLPPEISLAKTASKAIQSLSAASLGVNATRPLPTSFRLRERTLNITRGMEASKGFMNGVLQDARMSIQPGHGSFEEMLGVAKASKAGLQEVALAFCPGLAPVLPFLDVMHFMHIFKSTHKTGPGMLNARSLAGSVKPKELMLVVGGKKVVGKDRSDLMYKAALEKTKEDIRILNSIIQNERNREIAESQRLSNELQHNDPGRLTELSDMVTEAFAALKQALNDERIQRIEKLTDEAQQYTHKRPNGQTWCETMAKDENDKSDVKRAIMANRARLDWKTRIYSADATGRGVE